MISPQMNADERRYAHSDLTEKIIQTFYIVYNELGFGFLESVYAEAMTMALREAGLNVCREVSIPVWFRGRQIGVFKADLVVNNAVLVELKAARAIDSNHEAQTLNYLRATPIEVGLVLNFGPNPSIKRLVFSHERKKISVDQR